MSTIMLLWWYPGIEVLIDITKSAVSLSVWDKGPPAEISYIYNYSDVKEYIE